MAETLGELIKNFRKLTPDNQESLAEKVGRTKQWLGAIEVGKAIPTLEQLLRLHNELVSKDSDASESDLGSWLLSWLKARVKNDVGRNKEVALAAIDQLYGDSKETRKIKSSSGVPTLEDFPYGFENLVIVCGDRRESPPKSKGDFFVDSFSSADLASMKILFDKCGPLEIKSDKFFASGNLGNIDYLKQEYGRRNLIVIGSPAVNLLARALNKDCVFRFSTSKEVRSFLKYWDGEFPEMGEFPEINDRDLRGIFWEMVSKFNEVPDLAEIDTNRYYEDYKKSHPRMGQDNQKGFKIQEQQIVELAGKVRKLLKDRTAKDFKKFFRRQGFVDPVDTKEQGYFLRDDNDFGVVSLCPNPYSDGGNYFCILAAGIHAPGTDMAVRVLATDDTFGEHPLGGVIEVKLDLEARWSERFSNAHFDWQTRKYTIGDMLGKLRNPKAYSVLQKCDPDDLRNLKNFVQRFTLNTAK